MTSMRREIEMDTRERQTFGEVARPFCATINPGESAASALMYMFRGDCPVLPVAAPDGALMGVVLRTVLDQDCRGTGHEPACCEVRNHMVRDVEMRRTDEPFEGPENGGATNLPAPLRMGALVVVVDPAGRPVGYVPADTVGT
jgi:hypothetical protein